MRPTCSGVISKATLILLVNQLVFIPISICSFSWVNNQLSIYSIIESFINWKPGLFSSALLSLHRLHSSWATPAILGLITPEVEYHDKHQAIRPSSDIIISWIPFMPSIYLDAKCWLIHLRYLWRQIKIIALWHALPFKECDYSAFSYIIIHDQLFLLSHCELSSHQFVSSSSDATLWLSHSSCVLSSVEVNNLMFLPFF